MTQGAGAHTRRLKSGNVLFMEGDTGREMFVILKGSMLLYRIVGRKVRQGRDVLFGETTQTIAHLKEADFFGEMALLDGQPRSTCAVATSDTVLLVLDEANFGQVLSERPDFALRLMREFTRRIRALESQIRAQGAT